MVNAEETRAAFSGLIDKPPLTDQLLARPPFKFILDVVTSTISKTSFLKDQFPAEDLSPAKLNDKAAKMAFLDSLIQALNDGSLDDVKSSKIVAGKEPELTNLMLIKLAERAREYKKSKKSSKKSHHEDDEKEKSKTKHRSKSKEPKEEKTKTRSSSKKSDDEKKKKKEKKEKEGRHIEEEEKEQLEHVDRDINSNVVEAQADQGFDEPTSSHVESPKYDNAPDGAEHGEFSAPSNAFSPAKTDDSGVSDMTESPRPPVLDRPMTSALARPQTSMGRPGTAAARPAPPKLKRKQIATVEETNVAPVQAAAEVITEAAPAAPEETFLVEEEESEDVLPDTFKIMENEVPEDERGGLVQKMIDTTAEYHDGSQETADLDDEVADSKSQSWLQSIFKNFQKLFQSITSINNFLAQLYKSCMIMLLPISKAPALFMRSDLQIFIEISISKSK
ncbi:unnamed protein product [Cylicocyclus nassatus]|uniref:TRAF3-interacting protein 1 N-terminal domain-containing protein n=1 Tax=Cylicocyclus nassatus TaxID=53992 RepID=A0AA36HEF7_CYLNA|nr:unnamed protein product [Cylicocyclus nassatus]